MSAVRLWTHRNDRSAAVDLFGWIIFKLLTFKYIKLLYKPKKISAKGKKKGNKLKVKKMGVQVLYFPHLSLWVNCIDL